MGKERLLAFTDGVIAIIITIMVLDLKVPHEPGLAGIAAAFLDTRLADAIYVLVALMWLVPDRRIEKAIRPQ